MWSDFELTASQANTSPCTKEVCSFRDAYTTFQQHGALVFGLSSDPLDKLAKFAKVGLAKQGNQYLFLATNSYLFITVIRMHSMPSLDWCIDTDSSLACKQPC